MTSRTRNALYLIGLACSVTWGIVVGKLFDATVHQVVVAVGGATTILIVLAVLGVFDDLLGGIRLARAERKHRRVRGNEVDQKSQR